MRSNDHHHMALACRALGLAVLMLVLAAPPALAHALDGAAPTNYRTRILAVDPVKPGVTVEVVEAGNRLALTNTTDTDAVVIGYKKEPYLRVGPDGVFENLRSPATYLNRARLPSGELPAKANNPEAPPEWRKISDGQSARWHDHRVHWMAPEPPGPVKANPDVERVIYESWEVPIQLGEEQVLVKGDLAWVPGPSRLPWLLVGAVAGLALVGIVLGLGSRRPRLGQVALVGALAALVVLDVARLNGLAADVGSSLGRAVGQNIQAVISWVLAVGAAVFLLRGDTRIGPSLAAGAGVVFALGALGDLDVLSRSQVPTDAPLWLPRLAVAAAAGVGLGLLVVAFAPFLQTQPVTAASAPAAEPVAND